jgi:hypothetical protein
MPEGRPYSPQHLGRLRSINATWKCRPQVAPGRGLENPRAVPYEADEGGTSDRPCPDRSAGTARIADGRGCTEAHLFSLEEVDQGRVDLVGALLLVQ